MYKNVPVFTSYPFQFRKVQNILELYFDKTLNLTNTNVRKSVTNGKYV